MEESGAPLGGAVRSSGAREMCKRVVEGLSRRQASRWVERPRRRNHPSGIFSPAWRHSDDRCRRNSTRSTFWPTSPRAHRGSFHTIESSSTTSRTTDVPSPYSPSMREAAPRCSRAVIRPTSIRMGDTRWDEWDLGPVFAGGVLLIDDVERDPHMPDKPIARARLLEAGVRARIAVPVYAGGHVVGLFAVSSFVPGVYTDAHVATCRQIADLIGPFVQGMVLFQREHRRRARLQAITALAPILGTSLKGGDFLERLGQAVRPVLDFDAMALRVGNADRHTLQLVGVLDTEEAS